MEPLQIGQQSRAPLGLLDPLAQLLALAGIARRVGIRLLPRRLVAEVVTLVDL